MSKKLEKNGLWESSRMMLPQHKEQSILQLQATEKKTKPELDEQELELVSAALRDSKKKKIAVVLTIFGEYVNRHVSGIVLQVDSRRFRLEMIDPFDGSENWEWIGIDYVLKAELAHSLMDEEMIDI
jgi:hypothetical protein